MAMKVQINDARQLDDGVWKASLSLSDLRFLDPKAEYGGGPFSVVLLAETPSFQAESNCLSFDPTKARLVNSGNTEAAIFIINYDITRGDTDVAGTGDDKFLQGLPTQIEHLGRELLNKIREHFPGDLRFYPDSGKYVETPDNFWTIRPQPRDRSFRVTLRGKPESFAPSPTLELKPDMTGYSSVKIKVAAEVEELITLLKQITRRTRWHHLQNN